MELGESGHRLSASDNIANEALMKNKNEMWKRKGSLENRIAALRMSSQKGIQKGFIIDSAQPSVEVELQKDRL